ncbi:MAG: HEAT repeat domain-containing protein [bacterium]
MIQRISEEKDETDRRLLIGYLGKLGGREAVDFLLQELKENKYDAKDEVIEALGYAKDSRAVEPLINVLSTENICRREAVNALAEIGDKRAIEPLKKVLKTTSNQVEQEWIKKALKKLKVGK